MEEEENKKYYLKRYRVNLPNSLFSMQHNWIQCVPVREVSNGWYILGLPYLKKQFWVQPGYVPAHNHVEKLILYMNHPRVRAPNLTNHT